MDLLKIFTDMSATDVNTMQKRSLSVDECDPKERRKQQNRIAQRKYRRKMAQQARQSEQFALHAQHVLSELSRNQNAASHCPECTHCQKLVPAPSVTSELSIEFSGISNENIAIESPAIDFDTSFLEDEISIISPVATGVSSNAPPTPFSLIDYAADHLSDIDNGVIDIGAGATTPLQADNPDPPTTSTAISTKSHIWGNSKSQTEAAMHLAASKGQSTIVSILLRGGVEIDPRDSQGRTPLFIAVNNGHEEVVKILLAAGGDPSMEDNEGASVLLAAVKHGQERIVEMLLTTLNNR